jgi:hypothetical protein
MPLSSITQTDDIITPIITQLASFLTQYVPGIGRMYLQPPDGPPENNSVIFPMTQFSFRHDTNGKQYVDLTFAIRYMIRRSKATDDIQTLYKIFSAFIYVLSSWPIQQLNGQAEEVTPLNGLVSQFVFAGQPYMSLTINTKVCTEFPIYTS